MSPRPAGSLLDVLVIGGGQAGLAMGYHLAQSGRSFQIVDAGAEIGHVWRSRWESLRLFTSGRYDNLPGLPFPAAPDAYPGTPLVVVSRDEFRTYPLGLVRFGDDYGNPPTEQMAIAVLATIPIFLLFLLLQRALRKGFDLSALKG